MRWSILAAAGWSRRNARWARHHKRAGRAIGRQNQRVSGRGKGIPAAIFGGSAQIGKLPALLLARRCYDFGTRFIMRIGDAGRR